MWHRAVMRFRIKESRSCLFVYPLDMAAGKVIHILWIKVGIKTRYGEEKVTLDTIVLKCYNSNEDFYVL